MATDMNKVFLIGRATKDSDLKYTQGGTAIASLSLANNKTYTQGTEKKEQCSFFNCIAWGKLGETIAKYVKKGDKVAIEGRLQQRSYEDKDGHKRSVVEIVIDKVQFLSNSNKTDTGKEADQPIMGQEVTDGSAEKFDDAHPAVFSDEDIPF